MSSIRQPPPSALSASALLSRRGSRFAHEGNLGGHLGSRDVCERLCAWRLDRPDTRDGDGGQRLGRGHDVCDRVTIGPQ